jgi:diketogulonate reductase-like aldo/keto reductase
VNFKKLGNSGVQVPEIGIGAWRYKGGVEPLRRAIELEASLIDTAEIYGTEDVVGQAVGGVRAQVFIATKVSGDHLRYDDVCRAAESSLRRLNATYIDLYQIHWPNPSVPIRETMRAMETLVDRGLIRFIGVSNFSVSELRAAITSMRNYPIVSNQVLYNLNRREIERQLLECCLENQVTIIAYSPLDDGRLAVQPQSRASLKTRALQTVAVQANKTLAQVALNWCCSQPNVIAIPKSDSEQRVTENCHASGWRLSSAQIQTLNTAFRPFPPAALARGVLRKMRRRIRALR